jgi:hypothetical protein
MSIEGRITLPKMNGTEISPGIWLIGEPTPRPDLGKTALVCLANVFGTLGLVQLSIKFKENKNENS